MVGNHKRNSEHSSLGHLDWCNWIRYAPGKRKGAVFKTRSGRITWVQPIVAVHCTVPYLSAYFGINLKSEAFLFHLPSTTPSERGTRHLGCQALCRSLPAVTTTETGYFIELRGIDNRLFLWIRNTAKTLLHIPDHQKRLIVTVLTLSFRNSKIARIT